MKYKISKNISERAENWNIGMVSPDMDRRDRITHSRSKSLRWIFFGILAILFFFLLRMSYISLRYGDFFRNWSDNNHLRVFTLPGPRGLIYDRTGKQLVENISENILLLVPADVPKEDPEREAFLRKLSTLSGKDYSELDTLVKGHAFSFTPLEVASGLSHETVVTLKESFASIPSVFVSQRATRKYSDDELYSHVLGYVAPLNESNIESYVEKGYVPDERIGVTGLEKQYEDLLHGKHGKKIIEINAHGDVIKENISEETETGKSLTLSIVDDLQNYVTQRLRSTLQLLGKKAGVVLISSAKDGEILSAVSLPNFNSNMFGDGIKGEEEAGLYAQYLERSDKPLLNRFTSGLYAPASTFKIISASAVLEEGLDPTEKIDSPGRIEITDQFDPSKKYFYKDWKAEGHGMINVVDALEESSDTFFYQVIGGYEDQKGIGIEALGSYSRKFGLNFLTGIDIPGERAGLVPDPAWKEETRKEGWFTGDTYNNAIGQGYLLVTPLQVHDYTSIIANNGALMTPHFNKDLPVIPKEIDISNSTLQLVKQGLREVVAGKDGTAKYLQTNSWEVAGKTGTGQFNNNQELHAWFTGFAPYENPEIVITVLVEGGGEGSSVAVPIARDVIEYYIQHKEEWGL